MSQWDGKSKGAVLGYKIFIFFIQILGIRAAYVLLYLVALYFFLFSIQMSQIPQFLNSVSSK